MIHPIVLHIPHASTAIPEAFLDDYCISLKELEMEAETLGDLHTDTVFPAHRFDSVIFPYSRILVDVERFRTDSEEPMADRGMGALYTSGHDLRIIRKQITGPRQAELLALYDEHHRALETAVEERLKTLGHALIIDAHSFPKERLPYEDEATQRRPEICLGTAPYHTPIALTGELERAFTSFGYDVGRDEPFSGSIVPLKCYQHDARVRSIMIEIRRDLITDLSRRKKISDDLEQILGNIDLQGI